MRERLAWVVAIGLGSWLVGAAGGEPRGTSGVSAGDDAGAGEVTLEQIVTGDVEIVDLGHPLNAQTNFWPGDRYEPFRLETIATLEEDGVLSKAMCFPEHIGTHLDAPNHFETDQPAVDAIPAGELFARGVVIDVRQQCEQDPDYGLTVADVKAWERKHGRIPPQAVVLLNTGWSRFWDNTARFQNRDAMGRLHFPSYTTEAAEFLVKQRDVRGVGVDNLSIDRGVSQDFGVHHVVNGAGRYGLENVTNLDRLPPRGFHLVIAPIKVENGTGGPARVFAVLPKGAAGGSSRP